MEQDLSNVKYVGPATIKRLAEHGVSSVAQLAEMSPETLAALPGIGDNTAPLIIASAQELLAETPAETPSDTVVAEEAVWLIESETGEMLAEEIPADYHVATPEPELSKKELKKAAKKAKKALKKELKKAEKQQKALNKAAKKAEKKADKAEKAEKKAKKAKKKKD